jgi:putative glutamine transport system ATP-binding protein
MHDKFRKANSIDQPMVTLRGVDKGYKRQDGSHFHALADVSFSVAASEVITLIGPSGSGKSTCLRTINGLERIDSGQIVVNGYDLAQTEQPEHELRRNSAMIFQHFELFPHLTVLENIALAPHLTQKLSKAEARSLALSHLQRVGLAAFADQYPLSLSGGQKQRVAIARALAARPKVLLCDEPTSALDPELVCEITALLSEIAKDGMTMIIVTHEMSFARQVSHRCLFLEGGRVLLDQPVERFFSASSQSTVEAECRLANFLEGCTPESHDAQGHSSGRIQFFS